MAENTEAPTLRARHIALRRALERLHRTAIIARDYIEEREDNADAQAITNALQADLDAADEVLDEWP
jgi:hypothetical protein